MRGRRSGGQTLAAARRRRRPSQAALGLPAADSRRFGHSSSSVAAMRLLAPLRILASSSAAAISV